MGIFYLKAKFKFIFKEFQSFNGGKFTKREPGCASEDFYCSVFIVSFGNCLTEVHKESQDENVNPQVCQTHYIAL